MNASDKVMRVTGAPSGVKVDVKFFGDQTNLTTHCDTIELRICFSKEDTDSRPWRKINDVISVRPLASSPVP